MTGQPSLRDQTEDYIARPSGRAQLVELIKRCISDGGLEALMCVGRLYEDMYGGMTFNMEIKGPAAAAMLAWKQPGLEALTQAALRNPTTKNSELALHMLSIAAAGDASPRFYKIDPAVDQIVDSAISDLGIRSIARSYLVDLILSIPDDDDVSARVGSTLTGFSFWQGRAAQELFAAVSKRWLALSTPVLNEFDELIRTQPSNEPAFQTFLTKHPQLLDPLAHKVWPQPNLFGFREPDFILKRTDGTYLVIEIECPAKTLVTGGGHLSADATHAEQQAADYRRNLTRKYPDIRLHMPDFQDPDCLVVVGLERTLTSEQRQVLHDVNQGRNHLRIVGFDWLLDRGRTIAANVTQSGVEVTPLRMV